MQKIKIASVLIALFMMLLSFQNCDQTNFSNFESQSLKTDIPKTSPIRGASQFTLVLDEFPYVVPKTEVTTKIKAQVSANKDTGKSFLKAVRALTIAGTGKTCTEIYHLDLDDSRKVLENIGDARLQTFIPERITSHVADAAIYSIFINNSKDKVRIGKMNLKKGQKYTTDIDLKAVKSLLNQNKDKIFKRECAQKKTELGLQSFTIKRTNGLFGPKNHLYEAAYELNSQNFQRITVTKIRNGSSKTCKVIHQIPGIYAKKLKTMIENLKINLASGRVASADKGRYIATRVLKLSKEENVKDSLPLGEDNQKPGAKYFDTKVLTYIRDYIKSKEAKIIKNSCNIIY